jgi:hypothetical protein
VKPSTLVIEFISSYILGSCGICNRGLMDTIAFNNTFFSSGGLREVRKEAGPS